MPIYLSVPQIPDLQVYQLLSELCRRAVDGTVALPDGFGIVFVSPNGTKYRLGVANDGSITTTPV